MDTRRRVRFAPSPTGSLHVGGARTALFNYLFARHCKGTFILRIEDTDRKRFQEHALEEILTSLRWLGLEWDEGPERGGDYGPYVQSERSDLYREHAERLMAEGHAYRCFCTPERLAQVRKEQEQAGAAHVSGYDRHCRELPAARVRELTEQGARSVVRLKVPLERRSITFHDLVRGDIEYKTEVLDDLVLLKSDGFPTYHLANVVDDHFMGITDVLRGDEWIASTPRHILLYEAFGWEPPAFAHMPVILAPGGGKLSKRKGAASVIDFRRDGILPETLFNFLALLGWAPGDDREIMSREEIVEAFDLKRISPKAAVFDERKLEWMNGQYLARRSVDSLIDHVREIWAETGTGQEGRAADESYVRRVIELMKGRSRRIRDIAENTGYFFEDPQEYEAKAVKKHIKAGTLALMQELERIVEAVEPFDTAQLEKEYRRFAEEREVSTGKLIHPTRLALSGVSFGPGLFELMELLGRETVLRRMRRAREHLGGAGMGGRADSGRE